RAEESRGYGQVGVVRRSSRVSARGPWTSLRRGGQTVPVRRTPPRQHGEASSLDRLAGRGGLGGASRLGEPGAVVAARGSPTMILSDREVRAAIERKVILVTLCPKQGSADRL